MIKHTPKNIFKPTILIWLLLTLLLPLATNQAATNSVKGNYIREWLILGPFPQDRLDIDFLESIGGEKQVDPVAGDTILMLSDGFPELFNQKMEALDYEKTRQIFTEVAAHSPDDIIEHLNTYGEKWSQGRVQNDDITFVVIKIKSQ